MVLSQGSVGGCQSALPGLAACLAESQKRWLLFPLSSPANVFFLRFLTLIFELWETGQQA